MGCGACMSCAISLSTRFCAPVGLNGSMALDLFAHAIVQFERNARLQSRLGALQRQAALQPEEFLEDQPPLRGSAIGVEHAQVAIRGGKVQRADGASSRSGSFRRSRNVGRQMILERLDRFQHAMHQRPKRARGYLARPFVDRYDAAGMQRGVAVGIVAGENFKLRMHDQQVAGVAVEFHFAVKRDARAGQEAIHQIAAVKPFGEQRGPSDASLKIASNSPRLRRRNPRR